MTATDSSLTKKGLNSSITLEIFYLIEQMKIEGTSPNIYIYI